jgi:hypothetical protein
LLADYLLQVKFSIEPTMQNWVVCQCCTGKLGKFLCEIILECQMSHQTFNECIEACNACVVACNHCAASCLQEQDVKMMARCIALDMDCAQICALASAAMARGSEHARAICALCADICQSCGDECAKHNMAHCQQCAKACLQCAKECRQMSAMA